MGRAEADDPPRWQADARAIDTADEVSTHYEASGAPSAPECARIEQSSITGQNRQ